MSGFDPTQVAAQWRERINKEETALLTTLGVTSPRPGNPPPRVANPPIGVPPVLPDEAPPSIAGSKSSTINSRMSGLIGGLEGGIHAVKELWETLIQEAGDDPEKAFGTLLIDAENAFNAANRTAELWNARILWPRASTFLFNCYRGDAELFLRGTHGTTTISSREGWTQGDPMLMAGYAITILPLV
uniref:Reverse transcriptase domain-containing protein n=1 Tax=Chromera velia CCMP2878 TaxID=1169474 RepID=A0A0G4IEC1_9ALVE|eukprot:Cvel_2385.t1-p1 / transcript=Cvel_2385.t1 / gene=Cvel_2385 / organism=Chromera_velia_CCMP2878 / gene_product=hypothetical protein / transcript_product=hypothetical protein / location=Cvel_scaffold92:132051-136271(+) / protein_length=186 / sequence_SO=supercontig / SO=protein_coding / is_pseudo=false